MYVIRVINWDFLIFKCKLLKNLPRWWNYSLPPTTFHWAAQSIYGIKFRSVYDVGFCTANLAIIFITTATAAENEQLMHTNLFRAMDPSFPGFCHTEHSFKLNPISLSLSRFAWNTSLVFMDLKPFYLHQQVHFDSQVSHTWLVLGIRTRGRFHRRERLFSAEMCIKTKKVTQSRSLFDFQSHTLFDQRSFDFTYGPLKLGTFVN